MRSYDVPRARGGSSRPHVQDGLEENVRDTKVELEANLRILENSFNEVKAARRKILRSPSRASVLAEASSVLSQNKIRGLGKAWKAAYTEVECMKQEDSPIAGEQHITAYLREIKAEYARIKRKRDQLESTSVVDTLTEEAKELLKKYDQQSTKLSFGSRDVMIARAPIIPISSLPFDVSIARRSGLAVDNLDGYLLVNNQMVVGFRKLDRQKAKNAIYEMVDDLSIATKKKLFVVTDRTARYKGGIWYWVADQATLSALRKAGRGNLQIRDWGFGFSSE